MNKEPIEDLTGITVIGLRTTHDRNGNPRRLCVVFNRGNRVGVYSHDYENKLPLRYHDFFCNTWIEVIVSKYIWFKQFVS